MILYTGVAKRGVILFFVISELSKIDPMYQFSLNYFANLFKNIISNTYDEGDRITVLQENLTKTIFLIICRGLFNKHKQIFSFILAIEI
jgi:dynein heavy chain